MIRLSTALAAALIAMPIAASAQSPTGTDYIQQQDEMQPMGTMGTGMPHGSPTGTDYLQSQDEMRMDHMGGPGPMMGGPGPMQTIYVGTVLPNADWQCMGTTAGANYVATDTSRFGARRELRRAGVRGRISCAHFDT